jgi:hypothetical protein
LHPLLHNTATRTPLRAHTPHQTTHSQTQAHARAHAPQPQGCLAPISVVIPPQCLLNPSPEAAVVGGNVLTSQRVTDVVLRAFGAAAASQVGAALRLALLSFRPRRVGEKQRRHTAAGRLMGSRLARLAASRSPPTKHAPGPVVPGAQHPLATPSAPLVSESKVTHDCYLVFAGRTRLSRKHAHLPRPSAAAPSPHSPNLTPRAPSPAPIHPPRAA